VPSNQIDVNVSVDTPQSDFETLKKLTEALKSLPGAQGGGGGRVQQTFETAGEGMKYLNQQAAAAGSVGQKLSGASLKAEEGGGFTAGAKVDDVQKKAFSAGGMIAGMGTAVGAIGAGFKQLLGMSKIFQTFMGTTGKILGTAVDMMLAPMMPFFMRIMVWMIMTVFPLATKVGTFLGGLGDKTLAAGLVGGFVALKLGPTLLSKAGESLGKHFVEKMGVKTIGEGISKAFGTAVDTLKDWGSSVGGFIKDGLIAVKDTLKDAFKAVGGFIKDGLIEAKDKLKDAFKAVGGFIKDGLIEAKDKLKDAFKAVGGFIKDGLIEAKDKLKDAFKTVGGFIKDGLIEAKDKLKDAFKAVGGFIKEGLIEAKDALKDTFKTVGTFIKDGLIEAKDLMKDTFKTVGTFIKDGLIEAKDLMKDTFKTVGGFISKGLTEAAELAKGAWKTIGGYISTAASAVTGAAGSLWSSVGGAISAGIGKALTWTKNAGSAIGDAIGGAMKKSKQLWSGLGSVGGMIGIGIGAVAIGATIGYMIWKEYDKYQKGKDITEDLTKIEQVRMLQSEYGVGEQQAVMIQEGMEAGGVSTSRQGMTDYMTMAKDMADQIRLFGTYSKKGLASMERQEQLLFADMMEKGMYGESDDFKGMAKMIRSGVDWGGESIGSVQETLAKSELLTQEERRKAAEAEIEAQAWYAMSVGGKHVNFLERGVTSALNAISGGSGGGELGNWVTSKIGFGTAEGEMQEDEKKVRKALGRLYGTGSFKGDMTGEQANIGAWLSAYGGDAASSFFAEDVATSMLGGKYQDTEIKRMSGSVINIMLNTESLDFLSPADKKRLMEIVPTLLESGVVQSS